MKRISHFNPDEDFWGILTFVLALVLSFVVPIIIFVATIYLISFGRGGITAFVIFCIILLLYFFPGLFQVIFAIYIIAVITVFLVFMVFLALGLNEEE
jgi:hypothetical protein